MLRKLAYVPALLALAVALGPLSIGQPQAAQSNRREAQQPDKALYDHGIKAIQQKHFSTGRLSLQTLINTYESSELLPKAHLAIADSWYGEGGARSLARAQGECKQVIQTFPGTQEAKDAEEMLRRIAAETGKQESAPPR